MKIVILITLSLLFLGCQGTSYINKDIANKLVYVEEQKGPFDDTIIVKYYDKKLNTMCYMFMPNAVSTTKHSKKMTFINGFAGNISCVKL